MTIAPRRKKNNASNALEYWMRSNLHESHNAQWSL